MRDAFAALPVRTELLMDIQRYGADAEIIAPTELREQMRGMLAAALGRYAG